VQLMRLKPGLLTKIKDKSEEMVYGIATGDIPGFLYSDHFWVW
jgi:hypothetical protein